ncbi:kinase-like domain-containing protein [Melampsora americana]|nr:kinase-like domain-containing protein [Melampsora americana]
MATYQSRPNLVPSAPSHGASPSPGPSGSLQPGTKVQVGKYVVKVDKFLSEGGFAHVYVASLVSPSRVEGFAPTQNTFVLKRMAVPDKAGLVEVRKEVDVMKQLRPHKHVVYFIEASASSIVGGGIIDLLNSRLQNRLTESEILKIFSDTVEAVAHMHSQTPVLMHRDLKVENILVAAPNLYKLCDFGSTTTPPPNPPQSTAEIQALEADLNKHTTLQYRAPEMVDVWSRKGVTEKADIWALGVFLYKLCYYTTPFEEHGPMAILNVQYTIPSYPAYSNSIKYLIGTMLQESAHSRPDIWQVHEHTCKLRGLQPHLKRVSRMLALLDSHCANVIKRLASSVGAQPEPSWDLGPQSNKGKVPLSRMRQTQIRT